jgi:hypothetical protein
LAQILEDLENRHNLVLVGFCTDGDVGVCGSWAFFRKFGGQCRRPSIRHDWLSIPVPYGSVSLGWLRLSSSSGFAGSSSRFWDFFQLPKSKLRQPRAIGLPIYFPSFPIFLDHPLYLFFHWPGLLLFSVKVKALDRRSSSVLLGIKVLNRCVILF